jgi:pyruvate,orthophosphate dikinase
MNPDTPYIKSDALQANLLETAVEKIVVDPAFDLLYEIVKDFKGISGSLDALLHEISHPFRNWNIILPRYRAFVLKNSGNFCQHNQGPQAFSLFIGIFFTAISEAKKNEALLSTAIESLVAYLEKVVQILEPGQLKDFHEALSLCFGHIGAFEDQALLLLVQGQHPMKRIAGLLLDKFEKLDPEDRKKVGLEPLFDLMQKIFHRNYAYWLAEEDPYPWFSTECGTMCAGFEAADLFRAISHERLLEYKAVLDGLGGQEAAAGLKKLLELPAHIDIVRIYKSIPEKISAFSTADRKEQAEEDRFAENRKLLFLFRIMDTSGLFLIHEETLREINRSLVTLIRQQTYEEIEGFLLTTLQLLKSNIRKYPHTSLQCIQILGTEVFKRGNSRLVEAFLWETVRFGFQYANVVGIDEDWQPIANPVHLANIRVWLNLIMQEPKWCSTLFSALIVNLKLSGTCIKDTDLFQRDITSLLNHPIEPVYNLVKQFAKLMPVFFNEIGAEGMLRDVSTDMDEIHNRKDVLIHFLRKQSHVESSNLIVDFIHDIFRFWQTGRKEVLLPHLPPEIIQQVAAGGPFFDEMQLLTKRSLKEAGFSSIDDFLEWNEHRRRLFLDKQQDISQPERQRFDLMVQMYQQVNQKYNMGHQQLRHDLLQAVDMGFPEMEQLLADLEICDTFECLSALLQQLEKLKDIILSPKTFEAKESIYHKRHIAVDIPSVYGRYQERKFDALSLTFRLENLANLYLEQLPKTVNLSFITRATFIRVIKCLKLYLRALKIDGITSRRLETYVSLLSSSMGIKRFSYTQYLDIFRGLSEGVKDVIYAYYTNIHENNLSIIIPQIGAENLLARYQPLWDADDLNSTIHRLSETFMRDLIAGTFGLQHLDNFITRIYQTLESQKELLEQDKLDLLMTYNPERAISYLHHKKPRTNNLILLGNKGFNLTLLASDGKPVPPGFIITTEVFRCWPVITDFFKARDELMRQIRQSLSVLEEKTGKRYGQPENPLLLSVRSGAAISMPGMMATIHNVGFNPEIIEEFASLSGEKFLAWDNYRRFIQSWSMTKGLDREVFQNQMDIAKTKYGVKVKREFTPDQMKELALNYQKTVREVGIGIPEDPWLQLIGSIEMVLDSWRAHKTREYRSLMDISDSWGTAVIVQTMVFGNRDEESGSGVVFSAHPYRKVSRVALWGDYAPGDQGEDIVSGLVTTYPISGEQAEIDGRSKEFTLEAKFPEIYRKLLSICRELVYEKRWNPQEIEFTFDGPAAENLYILQTRDMITIKKKECFDVFEEEDVEPFLLGKGIGVSGSALSGRAVFTIDNIHTLRQEDPHTPLILIRQDTVPEDIKEISVADGLLTARGGQTSHASVVTLRLEKTCVVGCKALKVFESDERCEINGHTIRFGEEVSIDGRKGLFLKGSHPVRQEVHILPL